MLKEAFSVIRKYGAIYWTFMAFMVGASYARDLGLVDQSINFGTTMLWVILAEVVVWAIVFSENGVLPPLTRSAKTPFKGFYAGFLLKAVVLLGTPMIITLGLGFTIFDVTPANRDLLVVFVLVVSGILTLLLFSAAATWLPASIKGERSGFGDALDRTRFTFWAIFARAALGNLAFIGATLGAAVLGSQIDKHVPATRLIGGPWSMTTWILVVVVFWFNALLVTYLSVVISRAYLRAEQILESTRYASASPMDGADGIA
ncbi:hypothetical protein [Rhizobium sp. TRM95796]|uniref:hypothetical protein n=1 Tax=Rhizobium sp. TRM95796 TaxID=2979862 RepID=UPI0021E7D66C|nr:hypothetical protein [Rhizobium sp. TRM95796]MCV3765580.1 hypothetical protein [Rhizobium sp. TRM95796]